MLATRISRDLEETVTETTCINKAFVALNKQIARDGANAGYQSALSRAYFHRASNHSSLGNLTAARADSKLGIDVIKRLSTAYPELYNYQYSLSGAYSNASIYEKTEEEKAGRERGEGEQA